jgi:PAS domain S-box-containing protein
MAAMVALVALTAATIGFLTYRNIEAVVLPRVLERIEAHIRLLAVELEASVRSARADAIGFRSAVAVHGIVKASRAGGVDPADGMTVSEWRNRLARRFVAELEAKPNYTQFRIIGMADGGREILRVDRSGPGGAIRIVTDAGLQRKGDRDYFLRTVGLPADGVDVSAVELNREHGAIETPHLPVLRAATPIHAPSGEPFGIVAINVELLSAFARIRSEAERVGGQVLLTNERGDYLVHPDTSKEFAFERGGTSRVQDDFPDLAAAVGSTAPPRPGIVVDRRGIRYGAAAASVRLAQGPLVTLIELVPYWRISAATSAVRDSTLLAGLGAALMAIALSALLTRSLTRPLAQMTSAVEAFGRGGPIRVPTEASGEIGVLARAFDRMGADVHEKTVALEREIEERRRLFETSLDLILVVSRTGGIQRASPACRTILGYEPEEMVGRNGIEFVHPDDLEATRAEMRSARAGKQTRNFETRYVHKHGHAVTLSWTGVWSEPEQLHFFIGRDMTERIRLEQQLRHSQRMDAIGQLTGGVAHDFNNILTVITGMIDILADAVRADPALSGIVKMMDEAAERGSELTRHLLAFARKQPLQPRRTRINTLITGTTALLRPTLGEQIEIEVTLEENAWDAFVDPAQLTATLLNLAVNARDAMPDGGKLTIETGNVVLDDSYCAVLSDVSPGFYALIAVSDTGSGIPAAIRDKVFEPFFTTKAAGRGTGLGLSMVYGFVKQSGGHIKIYSEEGHGTTVKIYLPRADGHSADALQDARADASVRGGQETILIAEDDAMVRAYVTAQVESLGYRTLSAADGKEALAIIARGEHVDLLFTDVIMPGGLNGRQLADEARKRRPNLKVLFTSGYTENAIIHHGRLDPGVLLLAKPYRKAELARMIRTALDGNAASEAELATLS